MKLESYLEVQTLLTEVRRALCLLVPVAEKLGVMWREPHNYDDWDSVASGIYEGFALEAIRSSNEWSDYASLAPYDAQIPDYGRYSFIAVSSLGVIYPLICFESEKEPFDSSLVVELNEEHKFIKSFRLPFKDCQFVVFCKSSTDEKVISKLTW